jgi:hypothetical protein
MMPNSTEAAAENIKGRSSHAATSMKAKPLG